MDDGNVYEYDSIRFLIIKRRDAEMQRNKLRLQRIQFYQKFKIKKAIPNGIAFLACYYVNA